MYLWENPYVADTSWQELQVGDRVLVKILGEDGLLVEITEKGDYMVKLDSGDIYGCDGDMLVKVETSL